MTLDIKKSEFRLSLKDYTPIALICQSIKGLHNGKYATFQNSKFQINVMRVKTTLSEISFIIKKSNYSDKYVFT